MVIFISYNVILLSMELTESDNEYIIANIPYSSAKDIATVLGFKFVTVQSRITSLQKRGIIAAYSKTGKRDNRIARVVGMPVKDALTYLHYTLEMPLKVMGEYVGETRISITRSMKLHGIEWRSISQDNVRRFKHMPEEQRKSQTIKANDTLRNMPYTPRPHMMGEHNHQWKGGQATCVCAWCGKFFKRHASNIKTDKYNSCSKECQYLMLGLRFYGANSPNWKGGKDSNRGLGWKRIRSEVVERDNHECQLCNLTEIECVSRYKGSLHAHHKIPFRISKDNSLDNLITLCHRCHKHYEDLWIGVEIGFSEEI